MALTWVNDPRKREEDQQTVQAPATPSTEQGASAPWFQSHSAAEVEAQVWKQYETDPAMQQQAYQELDKLYKTPGNVFYNPYRESTNQSIINSLANLGVDVSGGINDDFFAATNGYEQYLHPSDLTGTPGKTGSKNWTNNEWIAYYRYQLQKDENTTKKAESEWAQYQKELTYWVQRGLTDDEALAKMDMSRFKTLKGMDDDREAGSFTPLNRAVGYSSDAVKGVMWAARNGDMATGDNFKNAVYSAMGYGRQGKATAYQIAKRTPGTVAYMPYTDGCTNDDARMAFGQSQFDQKWLQDNRWMLNDEQYRDAYVKRCNAEQTTLKAEDELKTLNWLMENAPVTKQAGETDYQAAQRTMSEWLDQYCPTLSKMDKERMQGSALDLNRSVDFRSDTKAGWLAQRMKGVTAEAEAAAETDRTANPYERATNQGHIDALADAGIDVNQYGGVNDDFFAATSDYRKKYLVLGENGQPKKPTEPTLKSFIKNGSLDEEGYNQAQQLYNNQLIAYESFKLWQDKDKTQKAQDQWALRQDELRALAAEGYTDEEIYSMVTPADVLDDIDRSLEAGTYIPLNSAIGYSREAEAQIIADARANSTLSDREREAMAQDAYYFGTNNWQARRVFGTGDFTDEWFDWAAQNKDSFTPAQQEQYAWLLKNRETTDKAEQEKAELESRIDTLAGMGMDWNTMQTFLDMEDYKTLQKIAEGQTSGKPVDLVRNVGYSPEAMQAYAEQAFSGANTNQNKFVPGTPEYQPYDHGATLDIALEGARLGALEPGEEYDQVWLDNHRDWLADPDSDQAKFYRKVETGIATTNTARAERDKLQQLIDEPDFTVQPYEGETVEEACQRYIETLLSTNDLKTLQDMDAKRLSGQALSLTGSVDYRAEDMALALMAKVTNRDRQLVQAAERNALDPNSPDYEPYRQPTNSAIYNDLKTRLAGTGIEVPDVVTEDWLNSTFERYRDVAVNRAENGAIKAPGNGATNDEWIAYRLSQLITAEQTTKAAEADYAKLQKDIINWSDLGYGADDIVDLLNENEYSTLKSLNNGKTTVTLNRGLNWGNNGISGVVEYMLGTGDIGKDTLPKLNWRDPTTYFPYDSGMTDNNVRLTLGINSVTQEQWNDPDWRKQYAEWMHSTDSKVSGAAKKIEKMLETSEKAEAEYKQLHDSLWGAFFTDNDGEWTPRPGTLERYLPDESDDMYAAALNAIDACLRMTDVLGGTSYDTLKDMDDARAGGNALPMAYGVPYSRERLAQELATAYMRQQEANSDEVVLPDIPEEAPVVTDAAAVDAAEQGTPAAGTPAQAVQVRPTFGARIMQAPIRNEAPLRVTNAYTVTRPQRSETPQSLQDIQEVCWNMIAGENNNTARVEQLSDGTVMINGKAAPSGPKTPPVIARLNKRIKALTPEDMPEGAFLPNPQPGPAPTSSPAPDIRDRNRLTAATPAPDEAPAEEPAAQPTAGAAPQATPPPVARPRPAPPFADDGGASVPQTREEPQFSDEDEVQLEDMPLDELEYDAAVAERAASTDLEKYPPSADEQYDVLLKVFSGEETLDAREDAVFSEMYLALKPFYDNQYATRADISGHHFTPEVLSNYGKTAGGLLLALQSGSATAEDEAEAMMMLYSAMTEQQAVYDAENPEYDPSAPRAANVSGAYVQGLLNDYYNENPEAAEAVQALTDKINGQTATLAAQREADQQALNARRLEALNNLESALFSDEPVDPELADAYTALMASAGTDEEVNAALTSDPYYQSIRPALSQYMYEGQEGVLHLDGQDVAFAELGGYRDRVMGYYQRQMRKAMLTGQSLETVLGGNTPENVMRACFNDWQQAYLSPEGRAETEQSLSLYYGGGIGGAAQAALDVVGKGIENGWNSFATGNVRFLGQVGEMLTSFNKQGDTSMIAQEYTSMYGAQARYAYRQQLTAYAASLPDDDPNKSKIQQGLNDSLAYGTDVFTIGIDLHKLQWEDKVENRQARMAANDQFMAENASESERFWYNTSSGVTNTGLSMAVAALTTAATGMPMLGTTAGFFPGSYMDNYDWAKGQGFTEEAARGFAFAAGAMEVITENEQLSRWYQPWEQVMERGSTRLAMALMQDGWSSAKGVAKSLAAFGITTVANIIAEYGQDTAQDYIISTMRFVTTGNLKEYEDFLDANNLLQRLAVVGITSGVAGSVQFAANAGPMRSAVDLRNTAQQWVEKHNADLLLQYKQEMQNPKLDSIDRIEQLGDADFADFLAWANRRGEQPATVQQAAQAAAQEAEQQSAEEQAPPQPTPEEIRRTTEQTVRTITQGMNAALSNPEIQQAFVQDVAAEHVGGMEAAMENGCPPTPEARAAYDAQEKARNDALTAKKDYTNARRRYNRARKAAADAAAAIKDNPTDQRLQDQVKKTTQAVEVAENAMLSAQDRWLEMRTAQDEAEKSYQAECDKAFQAYRAEGAQIGAQRLDTEMQQLQQNLQEQQLSMLGEDGQIVTEEPAPGTEYVKETPAEIDPDLLPPDEVAQPAPAEQPAGTWENEVPLEDIPVDQVTVPDEEPSEAPTENPAPGEQGEPADIVPAETAASGEPPVGGPPSADASQPGNARPIDLGERQAAVQTIPNAEAIPPEMREAWEQFTRDNPEYRFYERDTNNAQLARNLEVMRREGFSQALERLSQRNNNQTENGGSGLALDKESVVQSIIGMLETSRQTNEALNTTDRATHAREYLGFASIFALTGTEEGQAFQARKILNRLTPQGCVISAVREAATDQKNTQEKKPRVWNAAMQQADFLNAQMASMPDATVTHHNSHFDADLNPMQEFLIDHYHLGDVNRPGIYYNKASIKQRMLEAIIATPNAMDTESGLSLTQELELMRAGVTVTTVADALYIDGQMREANRLGANGDVTDSREAGIALGRAHGAMSNIRIASIGQRMRSLRYVNMLLSLPTAERNVIGNIGQNTLNNISRIAEVGLDKMFAQATGERTTAFLTMDQRFNAWKEMLKEVGYTWDDYMRDRVDTSPNPNEKFNIRHGGRTFQNPFLEMRARIEGLLMSVGDRPVWKKHYFNSIDQQRNAAVLTARMRGENISLNDVEITPEMRAHAVDAACYSTFTENNSLVDLMNRMKQIPGLGLAIDLAAPFTSVPTNIMKRQIEYSPIGLLFSGIRHREFITSALFHREGETVTGDQAHAVQDLARGLTGTLGYAAGWALAQSGILHIGTGDSDDPAEVNTLRGMLGDQYDLYIELGGRKYSISALAPSATPLILGSLLYDEAKGDPWKVDTYKYIINGMLSTVADSSWASSAVDAASALMTEGKWEDGLWSLATSGLQALTSDSTLSNIAAAIDPYARDLNDKNAYAKILKNVMYRWPGLRQMLPEKISINGQTMENPKYGARAVLSPFSSTVANNDSTVQELLRLYDVANNDPAVREALGLTGGQVYSSFLPNDALYGNRNTVTNGARPLTDEEKEAVKRFYGETAFKGGYYTDKNGDVHHTFGIADYMASEAYQNATDAERIEQIAAITKAAAAGRDAYALGLVGAIPKTEKQAATGYTPKFVGGTPVFMDGLGATVGNTNVSLMLSALYGQTFDGNYLPKNAPVSFHRGGAEGTTFKLEGADRDEFYGYYTEYLNTYAAMVLNDPAFGTWTQEEQTTALQKAYDKAMTQAKNRYVTAHWMQVE